MTSMRELEPLLQRAVQESTFVDVVTGQSYSIAQIQLWHMNSPLANGSRLLTPYYKTRVPDHFLGPLTDGLSQVLDAYVVNGEIGNGIATLVGGPITLSISNLIQDLIHGCAILGTKVAANRLQMWADGELIPYRRCVLLTGLSIERPIGTANGMSFESLPKDSGQLRAHLPIFSEDMFAPRSLREAVKVSVDGLGGPAWFRPSEYETGELTLQRTSAYGPLSDEFYDALCRAISLSCNGAVDWVGAWPECEATSPFGTLGRTTVGMWRIREHHPMPHRVPMSQEQLDFAEDLLLNGGVAEISSPRLNIAMDRWANSKRRVQPIDQLIELRIALEALYVPAGASAGEFGFRIATNGAWHLGANVAERQHYYDVLKQAYGLTSSAIHAGKVDLKESDSQLLVDAQNICRKGIIERLSQKAEPQWNAMILGSELDQAAE